MPSISLSLNERGSIPAMIEEDDHVGLSRTRKVYACQECSGTGDNISLVLDKRGSPGGKVRWWIKSVGPLSLLNPNPSTARKLVSKNNTPIIQSSDDANILLPYAPKHLQCMLFHPFLNCACKGQPTLEQNLRCETFILMFLFVTFLTNSCCNASFRHATARRMAFLASDFEM